MAILRGVAALALVLAAAAAAIDLLRGLRGGGLTLTTVEKIWFVVDARGPASLGRALGPWAEQALGGLGALPAAPALFVVAVVLFLVGRRRERHQVPIMR
jgi:hypothetical protein